MGLYVQTWSKKPKSKLFKKPLQERLVKEARGWAENKGLGELFHVFQTSPKLCSFTFYPLNESLRFEIDNDIVSIGLKTSAVGAGYHAAVIDLCDFLEARLGFKWNWRLSDGSSGDETNYAVDWEFNILKSAHFEQTINIMNYFDGGNRFGILVNCDLALFHKHDRIAGPKGYLNESLVENYFEHDESAASEIWKKLTLWNSLDLDQEFWLNTLESLLWTEFCWRPSVNDYEAYIEHAINECLQQIDNIESRRGLSEAVKEFHVHRSKQLAIEPKGVGYKKRNLEMKLPGPWKVFCPGYFVESIEDNGGTICLSYLGQVMRGSSSALTVEEHANDTFQWPSMYSEYEELEADKFTYKIQNNADDIGDGWFYGLGLGVSPIVDGKRHLLMFSITSQDKTNLIKILRLYFSRNLKFVESQL